MRHALRPSFISLFGCLLGASTLSTTAHAGDAAAAQALFDEGTRLVGEHHLAEACAKFRESQRQDPGIGTLYHFADCEDRLGKTATAWAAFLAVASEAKAQGQAARAAAAHDRSAALEPKLARLTIEPEGVPTPGLVVARDGETLGPSEWATAIPVDPGPHVIEARAPGRVSWTTTVTAAASAWAVVTIPALQNLPPATSGPVTSTTATTAAEVPTSHPGRGQRAAGIVLGAAGIVGLGIGGYFGVESLLHHSDANAHCVGNICDASGVALRNDAQQAGTVATVALSAGGAVFLTGLITYLTAPSDRASVSGPTVAIGPGSIVLGGSF